MRAPLFAIALLAAPAQAAGDIAAVFSGALEPALASTTDTITMYTSEEPQAFKIWSNVPPVLATYGCARNIALALESAGAQRGVIWLGVCRLGDELPADLIATAAERAGAAAAEPEIRPAIAGLGALVRTRRIAGAQLTEVTVLARTSAGAQRVLRTALIQPDGGSEVLVLQYEALRLCSVGDAPLCTDPVATLDALALKLLATLDRAR